MAMSLAERKWAKGEKPTKKKEGKKKKSKARGTKSLF